MKKRITIIISLIVAVALFVLLTILYNKLSESYKPEQVTVTNETSDNTSEDNNDADETDYSAPDFEMVDKNGDTVKLSDYFGKPIVVNMWASWCGPCQGEMPFFESAYKEFDDVQFIMLNAAFDDTKEAADSFIDEGGYSFPVFYDTTGEFAYKYGVSSFPTTFFIDEHGQLFTYYIGMLNKETLYEIIELIR